MQVHVIVLPNLGELFFEKQKKKNVLIKFILINLCCCCLIPAVFYPLVWVL